MKILVTGAAGQLGRALLASAPPSAEVIPATRDAFDLADRSAIASALADARPDVIVNAGAYVAVDRAESEEELAHAVNAHAVRAMAEALGKTGGRLVQVSTVRQPVAFLQLRNFSIAARRYLGAARPSLPCGVRWSRGARRQPSCVAAGDRPDAAQRDRDIP